MLSKEKIEKELVSLGIAPPKIIFYEEIDSTNTRAKLYAKENPGNKENVIFIANSQTGGRGRRGRSFVSNEGAGIYMSILSYPKKNGYQSTRTTAMAAVSLCRAVESLLDCEIKIKWVNDLFLGGKKLAGILTEGEMDDNGKIAYQVVGMGINVYKSAISDEISSIATSLESELNSVPDRSTLAAEIIKEFLYAEKDCYDEYKARSLVIGRRVTVIKLTESYDAEVLDINEDFSLKISTKHGIENLFTGEVSLKI